MPFARHAEVYRFSEARQRNAFWIAAEMICAMIL
jgi:hypothetical protein